MRDYKNKTVSLYREPREMIRDGYYLPPMMNGGSSNYIIFILLVLFGTSIFLYFKIKEKDNVFYEVYSLVYPEKVAEEVVVPPVDAEKTLDETSEGKETTDLVDNSNVDLLAEIIEQNKKQEAIKQQAEANAVGAGIEVKADVNAQEVTPVEVPLKVKGNLFLVKIDKNNTRQITLTFLEKEITTSQEKYFSDLLSTMLLEKSADNTIMNTFDETVKLNKAYVENNVLMLDFSKEFEYSKYGMVGMRSRIQQILWTVFSNSKNMNIEAISFTIDGQRKETTNDGYTFKLFYSEKDLEKQLDVSNV